MNFGLVDVNEETFNFKRVTRTEMEIGIIVLILVLFSIRYLIKRCVKGRLKKAAANSNNEPRQPAPPQNIIQQPTENYAAVKHGMIEDLSHDPIELKGRQILNAYKRHE